MKQIKIWMMTLILSVIGIGFAACGDDDEPTDASSLQGKWYASQLPSKGSDDWGGRAYYFESKNTVIYYPTIAGTPRWTGDSEQLTGPMKGYYIQSGNGKSYTYEVLEGKIYIPMKGTIMTISGNTLREDGGNTYTKM